MLKNECQECRKPKAVLNCGICENDLCKSCAEFLDAETFSFLTQIPDELSHSYYCPFCFSDQVVPALNSYQENMDEARRVYFFFSTQKKLIPVLTRAKEQVKVNECADRNETILRLGFYAAQQGFNAVVNAEVSSKKVRNEGYQKSVWSGMGFPARVDVEKLERSIGNRIMEEVERIE